MPAETMPLLFADTVDAEPVAVRDALGRMRQDLARATVTREELDTVELVLAEVFNNIAEHSYPARDKGTFSFSVRAASRGLVFEVRDRGKAMPDGSAPFGRVVPEDCERDDVPEGGFGWFLIRELAKDIEYGRIADENRLRFRVAVGVGP